MNGLGQVVGYSAPRPGAVGEATAFLFSDGVMRDINAMIAAASAGWEVREAVAINDREQILAYGYNAAVAEGTHLTLLTPISGPDPGPIVVPLPAACHPAIATLAAMGLVGVVRGVGTFSRRRRVRRPVSDGKA